MSISFPPVSLIQTVTGGGILGSAITGVARIPAFMANLTAVSMIAELALRGLSQTLSQIGFQASGDSWINSVATRVNRSGVRPYKELRTDHLIMRALFFSALSVVGTESVRLLGGPAPTIYNNVMALVGPLRIGSSSYMEGVRSVLGSWIP